MGKKIMILIIGILVIFLLFPSIPAITTHENNKEIFTNCYIKATGSIDFTWQLCDIPIGLRYRFISYWPIVFNEPNVDVTIYSKKNRNILWEDSYESGQWVLYLVGFFGKYNTDGSTDETLIANLDGRVYFVMIKTIDNKHCDIIPHHDYSESPISSDSMNNMYYVNNHERYFNCHIEISGYMHDDWPAVVKFPNMLQVLWLDNLDTTKILFGLYSYILFEEDANIKIYDKQDGTLLWQHEGGDDPLITLLGFSGECIIDGINSE